MCLKRLKGVTTMSPNHIGTNFDDFLKEEGIMTDKQIIIDGCNVSGCDELHINKANTIICDITGYLCEDRPNCYYKQLKRKEQECEELKKANLHIENNREHKANKLNRIEKLILACTTGYTDEFIQELLVILHEPEPVSFENKYLQTLAEIKEIAEKTYRTPLAEKDCIKCDEFLEQILQKISEVEDVSSSS
jgi:hypothetical protein